MVDNCSPQQTTDEKSPATAADTANRPESHKAEVAVTVENLKNPETCPTRQPVTPEEVVNPEMRPPAAARKSFFY